MGIFMTPVEELSEDARRAADEGRSVFTAQYARKREAHFSGELTELGEVIEAIEAEGWTLQTMDTCAVGTPLAPVLVSVMVFRAPSNEQKR